MQKAVSTDERMFAIGDGAVPPVCPRWLGEHRFFLYWKG